MRSHPSASSLSRSGPCGPFTMRCPTCPSVPAFTSQARLPHVSTLSGPGTRPGIRPVIRKDHRRRGRSVLVAFSWCLSAAGVRFLGILSRPGDSALLRVGLPPARDFADRRTRTRFPCSARRRPGWGGCPLYSGGRRCSRDRSVVLGRRLPPLHGAVPATPVVLPVPRFDNDEALARLHGHSPGQPSPHR